MPMNPRLLRPRQKGGDPDALLYIAAVQAADGQPLEDGVRKAIDAFIAGCKADGIWSAIKAGCILAGARTLAGALTPLVGSAPTNFNFVSGDYDRKTGLKGNGSTKYLDTGRAGTDDPLNSSHFAAYATTAESANFGAYIGTDSPSAGDTSRFVRANTALTFSNRSAAAISVANAGAATGFIGCNRATSAGFEARVSGVTSSQSTSSGSRSPINFFVFGVNIGSLSSAGNSRLAFYSIGESLDLALLDARVSALYTAIGAALAPNYADADVNAYITAVELADGGLVLEAGVRDAINAFITGCKADGIWSAIKASCILAGARTLAGALVPLVGSAPTNFNFVSGDYNRKTGLVGDGSTKYLNSNRNNNADPQDSQHAAVFVSTSTTSGPTVIIGTGGSTGRLSVLTGASYSTRSRSSTAQTAGAASAGLVGVSRSVSTSYIARTGGSSNTVSVASQTPLNENIGVFAQSTGFSPTVARLAFYSIGESLDLSLLDTRVSALYTAIGAAIP